MNINHSCQFDMSIHKTQWWVWNSATHRWCHTTHQWCHVRRCDSSTTSMTSINSTQSDGQQGTMCWAHFSGRDRCWPSTNTLHHGQQILHGWKLEKLPAEEPQIKKRKKEAHPYIKTVMEKGELTILGGGGEWNTCWCWDRRRPGTFPLTDN